MAFDFENNIDTTNTLLDPFDKASFVQWCNDAMGFLHVQAIPSCEDILYIQTKFTNSDCLKLYTPNQLFSLFLKIYDNCPVWFNLYDINVIPIFEQIFRKSVQVTQKYSLLSDNLCAYHIDLARKYFQINQDRIKYDIPMILSYIAFANTQLKRVTRTSKCEFELYDNYIKFIPDIITKEELWQFILTIKAYPSKFDVVKAGATFDSMLINNILYHYDLDISPEYTHMPGYFIDKAQEVYSILWKNKIRVSNRDSYILSI